MKVAEQQWSVARAGAAMWMCCLQFFVAEQIARLGLARSSPPCSFSHNYISDLGATVCITLVGGVCVARSAGFP